MASKHKILLILLYIFPLIYLANEVFISHEDRLVAFRVEFVQLVEEAQTIVANNPQESIRLLKKAIAIDHKQPSVFNTLCVAYNINHQYQEGIKACKKALRLDPNFDLAKNNIEWAKSELAR